MADPNRGAKITLYWLNHSRSQRIVWLLEELHLNYELKVFHRESTGQAPNALKDIHPLGKSPVLTIEMPDAANKPLVLAESGAIVEYLCDHFDANNREAGQRLLPERYRTADVDGVKKDQIAGETEEWIRYRYYMHYAEGSLMPFLVFTLILNMIKSAPVPFFIKPITNMIVGRVNSSFLQPNLDTQFAFLESQLASSPSGASSSSSTGPGDYLCGPALTAADILMSFPLIAAVQRVVQKEKYPLLVKYVERIQALDGYQRAVKKVEEIDGKPYRAVL